MGVFNQNGQDFPLLLKLRPAVVRKPGAAAAPTPICREVSFPSRADRVELHGTLTLPADGNPRAAVILVTGSGLQNFATRRFSDTKPFLVIADHLTRRGYAVLRYDDRGSGPGAGPNTACLTTPRPRGSHSTRWAPSTVWRRCATTAACPVRNPRPQARGRHDRLHSGGPGARR